MLVNLELLGLFSSFSVKKMFDIVDDEERDKDTIDQDGLLNHFKKKYSLIGENVVCTDKSYVNKLSGTKSLKLVLSLSNNKLEVYELRGPSVSAICKLRGHSKTVTEVLFSPKEDNLIYSCGLDGVIKLWDVRAGGSCVQEYKDEEATETRPLECMDISSTGRVLCAGSQLVQDDAFLIFWDSRATTPLGGYWNSHTDDITQVKFHQEKSEILATGASDGLVNIFNILEQTEDDALTYSLNIENSVETLNWLDSKHFSCITQSNDLQIWDSVNGDLLKTFTRSDICKSIKRSKEDDCYAVNTFTSAQGVPVLLAGSHADNGSCLRSVSIGERRLQPCTDFSPNKQVVRCCWYHPQEDLLVTAGEAGSVDVWKGEGGAEPAPLKYALGHRQRYKPY